MPEFNADHEAILGALSVKGMATSLELQASMGKSQATVSRLLGDLSSRLVTIGKARSTRYGLPESIHGQAAQQPIWWIQEDGSPRKIGLLSLLGGNLLHVEAGGADFGGRGVLPWFLSPLKAQGFLGRVLAQRLAADGLGSNPDGWSLQATLYAALHLHDAPGAIVLGESPGRAAPVVLPEEPAAWGDALDALALDVAHTLPAGSSAGGEQPKFLAALASGRQVLVKFSPPRGTPFGERWHDLLHAEALACAVLAGHGVEVALCSVVHSSRRSYLLSERFDRIGPQGRRHVVSVGAAHAAFVPGSYRHWGASCEALARQKRLDPVEAARAGALLDFGRLIGNTDMHAGNLGLTVSLDGLAKGRFTGLAPVYDMLPMRWRPNPELGGAADYAPFELNAASAASGARGPASAYWQGLAVHAEVSKGLRHLAGQMSRLLA